MKILDKYFFKGFIMPLLYCLIMFYVVYIVADVLGHLDDILRNKVPLNIMAQFYLFFWPLIFIQTAPIAVLLATVYLLSTMNKNNELTAMKASGINIYYAMRPVFITGIIVCLGVFYINENIIPKAYAVVNNIKTDYIESIKKEKETKSIKNVTLYTKTHQMLYAKNFDAAKNKLSEVIILEHDKKQNLRRKIIAGYALWLGDKWRFHNVIIYRFDEEGQPLGKVLTFETKIIKLPEKPSDLMKGELMSMYMNYPQLKTYIGRLKGGDENTIKRLKTDLYFKASLPFISLVMIFLGIPFSLTTVRGGVASSVGISILLGLAYYASIGISLALGKGNVLPPVLAAHLSNVAFFILAIVLIKKAPN
ncbi:MAG: LptF/LptG family permease [Candidatus Omnitrophica bacterium]|nr:LptF/LptG family permease [Candidatus Omnitrophota bacterium]